MSFKPSFGFLLKAPVDRAEFLGEVDEVRERVEVVSACAGETARDKVSGVLIIRDGTVVSRAAFESAVGDSCGNILPREFCSGEVLVGTSRMTHSCTSCCFPANLPTVIIFVLEGFGVASVLYVSSDMGGESARRDSSIMPCVSSGSSNMANVGSGGVGAILVRFTGFPTGLCAFFRLLLNFGGTSESLVLLFPQREFPMSGTTGEESLLMLHDSRPISCTVPGGLDSLYIFDVKDGSV